MKDLNKLIFCEWCLKMKPWSVLHQYRGELLAVCPECKEYLIRSQNGTKEP